MSKQETISQLQTLEYNLQLIQQQREQLQQHLDELTTAATELAQTDTAYKVIGGIMIKKSKDELIKETNERKELVQLRITTMTEHEKKLHEQMNKLQQQVKQK